ncbi:hypothetical protein JD76_06176 [Micromonospora endolithica]|nr:hypothetical protein JD76_06176 [Micromonospora endolithica]
MLGSTDSTRDMGPHPRCGSASRLIHIHPRVRAERPIIACFISPPAPTTESSDGSFGTKKSLPEPWPSTRAQVCGLRRAGALHPGEQLPRPPPVRRDDPPRLHRCGGGRAGLGGAARGDQRQPQVETRRARPARTGAAIPGRVPLGQHRPGDLLVTHAWPEQTARQGQPWRAAASPPTRHDRQAAISPATAVTRPLTATTRAVTFPHEPPSRSGWRSCSPLSLVTDMPVPFHQMQRFGAVPASIGTPPLFGLAPGPIAWRGHQTGQGRSAVGRSVRTRVHAASGSAPPPAARFPVEFNRRTWLLADADVVLEGADVALGPLHVPLQRLHRWTARRPRRGTHVVA